VPATDDLGNLAYLAKWSSVSGGNGAGIFTRTKCVAKIGGNAPGLGATYKTLSDPVLGLGSVAFLASLAGVPAANSEAVFSGYLTDQSLIAESGVVAPGNDGLPPANGAMFKKFQAVAVDIESVEIMATLSGGTPRVTAANDSGLWVKDATHPLTLVLREGQSIGNRTIKSIFSFGVGNGSPGQGRGWLVNSAYEGTKVLALVTFVGHDKAQAVLSVDLTGGVEILSHTGPILSGEQGGPKISGASFASYGVPALNLFGQSAFLASLAAGGTVTKANAHGIFVDYGDQSYTCIAREGEPATAAGAVFSSLKDPVLADDGGVAFAATLKGGGVSGLPTSTLWWKPATGPLRLLAQGGMRPSNDMRPEAQWKSFSSLAISPGRGPLFIATLVPGKGGVTAANASGVWGIDSTGELRLLFRTGDVIAGATLKNFTLLNATVGSLGVTRSFEWGSRVVWLATFTNNTTAIMRTSLP
jgi:hypothetical protein